MAWNPPTLTESEITLTAPEKVADPAAFMQHWLDSDAIAVVERHDEVRVVRLGLDIFDDRTTYVHAFSEGSRCDARAVRVGDGWIVDAVREEPAAGGGMRVWARPGRHLCLGKAGPGPETAMQEARIRPYSLPVPIAAEGNAVIDFVDYFTEDTTTGDLHCIAHRVIAIRSMEHG